MWRPGFEFVAQSKARATGYSRRFCVQSVHHRGSESRSGLVLGLDRGGVCDGVAFRVAPNNAEAVLDYLRDREQVNGVYRETRIPIRLAATDSGEPGDDGPQNRDTQWHSETAVAYLVERAHPSYVGRLSLANQARRIVGARGVSGDNLEYVLNTLALLKTLDIRERELERLATLIGGYAFGGVLVNTIEPAALASRLEALSRAARLSRSPYGLMLPVDQRRRFQHRRFL